MKNVSVQTIRWDLELCAKKAEKLLNFCQISMVSTEIRKKSGVSEIGMFNHDLKVVFGNHK